MASKLYEPAARGGHASFSVEGKVYVRGGDIQESSGDGELACSIEQFDPCLEVWRKVRTTGTSPLGLESVACTSSGEHAYAYGGCIRKGAYAGVTGQNLPPEIFSGGENILRTNSPSGVNSLGKYLPL